MITDEVKAERKQQRRQQAQQEQQQAQEEQRCSASQVDSSTSAALSTSGSTLALYLMVSAFLGFFVIRLVTTQEIVVALGTIVLAVVGMWLIAFLSKLRLVVRSFRYHQVNGKEKPAHKIHEGIANARYR
jgi:Flp pilus assembly protein TadB